MQKISIFIKNIFCVNFDEIWSLDVPITYSPKSAFLVSLRKLVGIRLDLKNVASHSLDQMVKFG